MANASVTWIPLPTANDTVDGPINATSIVCSDDLGNVVESDDRFQVRLTTVTCRVNDSASLEGMCQFNITVEGTYSEVLNFKLRFIYLKTLDTIVKDQFSHLVYLNMA